MLDGVRNSLHSLLFKAKGAKRFDSISQELGLKAKQFSVSKLLLIFGNSDVCS